MAQVLKRVDQNAQGESGLFQHGLSLRDLDLRETKYKKNDLITMLLYLTILNAKIRGWYRP